jgi:hypothetical protein
MPIFARTVERLTVTQAIITKWLAEKPDLLVEEWGAARRPLAVHFAIRCRARMPAKNKNMQYHYTEKIMVCARVGGVWDVCVVMANLLNIRSKRCH